MTYYQQGDVIAVAIPVEEVPKGKPVPPTSGKFVIARGEATGHSHALAATNGVTLIRADGALFLRNLVAVTLAHEEHGPVTLPPGAYRFRTVREYDHFLERTREVVD